MRRLFVVASILAAVGLVALGGRTEVARSEFEHSIHGEVDCVNCHHDWAEPGGLISGDSCASCHLGRPGLRARLEEDFHRLCRGCHVDERSSHPQLSAPAARCSECHIGTHLRVL
jgi:hypothetical protein